MVLSEINLGYKTSANIDPVVDIGVTFRFCCFHVQVSVCLINNLL